MSQESETPIERLITALSGLPGIGPRSAQRLVFHILTGHQDLGSRICNNLTEVLQSIRECDVCRDFTTQEVCSICADKERDRKVCVVESSADLQAVEQSGGYRGYYFVLHGKLSPLEGMGPDNLRLDKLRDAIEYVGCQEVILATNLTVEGEITAHYIKEFLNSPDLRLSRIAHGVPSGGELEYVDPGTLARALSSRSGFDEESLQPRSLRGANKISASNNRAPSIKARSPK